jgi:hypothetical protein
VRDEVDLREPRDGLVPAIRLEGDVVLEQGVGLGPSLQPLTELAALGCQPAIDLARADAQQLLLHGGPRVQPTPGPGQP